MDKPPTDPADHAEEFARTWADRLDQYAAERMEFLGVPHEKIGANDLYRRIPWRAFDPSERSSGSASTGIVVDSGCRNPNLLKSKKGARVWPKARLRDRIDAIIAHEFEEDRLGSHEASVKSAPKTGFPISDGARRILRAMGR